MILMAHISKNVCGREAHACRLLFKLVRFLCYWAIGYRCKTRLPTHVDEDKAIAYFNEQKLLLSDSQILLAV